LANLKYRWKNGKPVEPPEDKFSTKNLQKLDIIEFATECLGLSFAERPGQEVVLRSLYGMPLSDEQIELYRKLTTNEMPFKPDIEKTEAVWAVGARGGKSTLASIIALYESICRGHIWKKYLQEGEVGYCVLVATRQAQSEAIIQRNATRLLEQSKVAYMLEDSWQAELSLKNKMRIVSMPCNSTAARGLPIFLLVFDEIGHYRVEGVKADEKIYSSLRPRQAQFPGSKCLLISTPSAKMGLFWDMFAEGFSIPGRLTIQAATRTINPTIPADFIAKEFRRDADNAAREFDARFAEQVHSFFPVDRLQESFVLQGDLPPESGCRYYASCDQSGLAGRDRFAFAISHKDNRNDKKVFVDICRAWDTTDSNVILQEINELTTAYKIREISIDRYGFGWIKSALEKLGLKVTVRESLPGIYVNAKSLIIASLLELPDNGALKSGLMRTMAYYNRNNSLSISHERSATGHADEADAVCAAVWAASQERRAPVRRSPEELRFLDEQQKRLTDYDPLNYGL
jgi:hypothetical protein